MQRGPPRMSPNHATVESSPSCTWSPAAIPVTVRREARRALLPLTRSSSSSSSSTIDCPSRRLPPVPPPDEGDATEIWWTASLKQGRALELSGRVVVVKHTGLYLIYSQVLFHDPTFTMGQVLQRQVPGQPAETLFRCVQSMPANPEQAYNSCYSGGIFHLQHGDHLTLCIPRFNASFDASPHGTFLGLLRL